MQNKQHIAPLIALIGLIVLMIGGYVFISSPKNPALTEQPQKTDNLQMLQGNVKTFTVTATNYAFQPSELRVKTGDNVVINFENKIGYHDFIIDGLNVFTRQLPPGQKETVTFIANIPGVFEYYCSVANHKQMGMAGKFIVE